MGNEKLGHLRVITGIPLKNNRDYIFAREQLKTVLSDAEKIEANKDKLDLKPNVDFVSTNKDKFETGVNGILQKEPDKESIDWSENITFNGVEDIVFPQISPDECKKILARMPKSLIQLSKLEKIDYHLFNSGKHLLPVPGFNEDGSFNPAKVFAIESGQFPRKKDSEFPIYRYYKQEDGTWTFSGKNEMTEEEDHPSRILVGVSNGTKIYPTPIPKSVSEDERAVYLYQFHVLLHEFLHTIDYPRRNPEDRSKILLEVDGQQFTFQDWWLAFEELILSGKEPQCVSSYANTYFDDLNEALKESDYGSFTSALAEQICETFVAYQLNIISNDEGWNNFKSESFGNVEQLTKFAKQESGSANFKWILMDKLCRANVIRKE